MQDSPKALLFDIFGTVVDWRTSIIEDLEPWFAQQEIKRDWEMFAQDWRSLYQPAMETIRSGNRGYVKLDTLHRENLEQLISKYELEFLSQDNRDYINRVWHRLNPWPDVPKGLTRLKKKHILAPLSNGNVALMVNLARHAGFDWDVILGSEVTGSYKPDPVTYLRSMDLLGLQPAECMMVAAHNYDLDRARSLGMQTAFIPRPTEYGDQQKTDFEATDEWTVICNSMEELADQLEQIY